MKKLLISASIAAAFIATPAAAQFYVGFGAGSSTNSGGDFTNAVGTTLRGADASKGSYKVFAGYQFTPNWGAEAQYSDLGNRSLVATNAGAVIATGNVSATQFSIAATGTLPLASGFSLIGKLGFSNNSPKLTLPLSSVNGATSVMVGIGASYNFTPAISARLEYEDFGKSASFVSGTTTRDVRTSGYSLSLKYAF